jgi:hypothetical protein
MATKITEHYFEFDNRKYHRGNAHDVELGTYGQKKDPIGPDSYLAPQNKVKSEYLEGRARYKTRVKVNWNETTKAAVEAQAILKYFSLGKEAALSFNYEKAKDAKLELISLAIDEGPLKTMLNKDADGARNFLADEGNDGRIVSEVWIVVDAELGEHFATYGSASAAVRAAGSSVTVTVTGGKQGSQTVNVSKGTTFAYELYKVKDWDQGKKQILDMEDDYKGLQ